MDIFSERILLARMVFTETSIEKMVINPLCFFSVKIGMADAFLTHENKNL